MTTTTYADRRRHKAWQIERARGITHMTTTDAIRAHVDELLAAGMTTQAIAEAAGYVASTTLRATLKRNRIHRATEARILAVTFTVRADRPQFVPAIGYRRRLRALAAIGWSLPDLAARTTVPASTLRDVRSGIFPRLFSPSAAGIADLYDRLAMTPGPTPYAQHNAERRGWAPPLAWDDDSIDDPAAQPDRGRTTRTLTRAELIEEFTHTRDEHGGSVRLAAARLGVRPKSLARALHRARAAGVDVRYSDDSKSDRSAA